VVIGVVGVGWPKDNIELVRILDLGPHIAGPTAIQ
jgi:hypothetical protein